MISADKKSLELNGTQCVNPGGQGPDGPEWTNKASDNRAENDQLRQMFVLPNKCVASQIVENIGTDK